MSPGNRHTEPGLCPPLARGWALRLEMPLCPARPAGCPPLKDSPHGLVLQAQSRTFPCATEPFSASKQLGQRPKSTDCSRQSQFHLLFRALTHHTGREMPSDSSCPGLEYILCPVHLIVTVCVNKAQGLPTLQSDTGLFLLLAIIKYVKATQVSQPLLQSSEFTGLVHRGGADMAAGEEGQLVTQEATQAGNDSGLYEPQGRALRMAQ